MYHINKYNHNFQIIRNTHTTNLTIIIPNH